MTPHLALLRAAAAGGPVLELGCDTGRDTRWLLDEGFAVVANEVKELAAETARATQDITHRIDVIRNDTQGATAAISEIRGFIGKMNEVQGSIAAAIEEHSVTTAAIARSLGDSVRGTGEISSNISGVAEAARHTSAGASDTKNAASELSRMATELRRAIGQFAY